MTAELYNGLHKNRRRRPTRSLDERRTGDTIVYIIIYYYRTNEDTVFFNDVRGPSGISLLSRCRVRRTIYNIRVGNKLLYNDIRIGSDVSRSAVRLRRGPGAGHLSKGTKFGRFKSLLMRLTQTTRWLCGERSLVSHDQRNWKTFFFFLYTARAQHTTASIWLGFSHLISNNGNG